MGAGRITLAVVAALAAATVGGAATWTLSGDEHPTPDARTTALREPDPVVQTSFPDLPSAPAEPQLAGLGSAHPQPGEVDRVAGPFDDRLRLTHLSLGDRAVTGEVHVTSDVSDVLELQVVAGFYDARGRYVGSGRFIHHDLEESHGEGPPSESWEFTIDVPRAHRDDVRSAAVGVPVLVNE